MNVYHAFQPTSPSEEIEETDLGIFSTQEKAKAACQKNYDEWRDETEGKGPLPLVWQNYYDSAVMADSAFADGETDEVYPSPYIVEEREVQ